MSPGDSSLLEALRRGEAWAFERVYKQYKERVFSFLARMTGRRDVAEDLFQETWIKLALHAHRLADDTDLGGWLYTVARNLARSDKRARAVRPMETTLTATLRSNGAASIGQVPSPFDWTAATQAEANLEIALLGIPQPLREVLLLVVVEGLAQDRAAEVLGVTHDALRQRLARARAALTQRLEALESAPRRGTMEEGHAARRPAV